MKVKIPRTLAEPLTIPWELIGIDDDELIAFIKKGLHRYMGQIIVWEENEDKPPYPHFTKDIVLACLRVVARKRGGLEVTAVHGQLLDQGKKIGDVYQVFFKTRVGGPSHSSLLMPK